MKRTSSAVSFPLTELHCHLLPGIDDGASSPEVSIKMLEMEKKQGVKQILFTPHFYLHRTPLDVFLEQRLDSAYLIKDALKESGMLCRFGAEVRMEDGLLNMDLRPLTMGKTDYLLLEWPMHSIFPLWGEELVDHIFDQGLTPVFAHIERFDWFWDDPDYLEEFVDQGVISQMNAGTILDPASQKKALRLIDDGLVHVVASDAHGIDHRVPNLGEAMKVIEKKLGSRTAAELAANADKIFRNQEMEEKSSGFSLFKRK